MDPATGRACYSGLQTCLNVWTCPVCSVAVGERRADEIRAAGLAHLTAGGGLSHLILTLSHQRSDSLATSLDAVRDAWRAVLQSRGFRRSRDRVGLGFVRAVEVTWGQRNGWHPHMHLLLFTSRDLTPIELEDLAGAIHAAWSVAARSRGRNVSEASGTMLNAVRGAAGADVLAGYLTKSGVSGDIAREIARGDAKRGKGKTPFQLAELAVAGHKQSAALWLEYVDTIKGAKRLSWSNGLRDDLGLGAEVTDEEAARASGAAEPLLVATLDDLAWSRVVRYGARMRLLDATELRGAEGAADVLDLLRRREAWEVGRREQGRT